jgi:PIN domain nuclease of toxin-antitoxin system
LKLLLDTHIFVWAINETSRLDRRTQAALASPDNLVLISSVSPWEIGIKQALGRMRFPLDLFDEMIERMDFDVLPILPAHGIVAAGLPRHHNDPFDRMLIAQALTQDLTLVSADRVFTRYDVSLLGNA